MNTTAARSCHGRHQRNEKPWLPIKEKPFRISSLWPTILSTILQDDEGVGGPEVMDKSDNFVLVDPWSGTLIFKVGDMATVWSNGRFCNVKHRVQCKKATIRVSIAPSLLGPREAIEPLLELVDVEHPRAYMPTTYEDYRKWRFSQRVCRQAKISHYSRH
ncbi:hypothetical protein L6452_10243 [Arctium lappa]|uniref:Uncharacterized protein n=1 Tax=Arctium lappa TaxID=4217 RepID=A0ACB9DMM8_ARCLA|nr:hypothetical protein L6452_10243 [Arctium lappa]